MGSTGGVAADRVCGALAALSGRYYLAEWFPFLTKGLLPLITGYLAMGVIVGPFVTNMVSSYVHRALAIHVFEPGVMFHALFHF